MPDQKTLLLLGGSADQVFSIRTAKAMGLRTVVVDMEPESPGFRIADEYAVVSTRDVEQLKAFVDSFTASKGRIDGVMVQGSDIPQVVCALAEHLGTPSIPMDAALVSTHKLKMKERFRECGVPVPWFASVNSADQVRQYLAERPGRLVLKPVDRSGARGVLQLDGESDVDAAFDLARSLSFSGEVMVEAFIPGLQISTETIMYQGCAHTVGFADRNYEKIEIFKPNIIENGGWVPTVLGSQARKRVEALVEQAAHALGVENGVVKGDIVIAEDGTPLIIEMATRLSGGDFAESLIPLGTGVNIVEAAIRIAVGDPVDESALLPSRSQAVVNRYFFPPAGRLVSIGGEDQVRAWPWVKKLEFWYKPGTIVPPVKSHADRFGVFIVVGDTREQAEQRAEQVYEAIDIDVAPVGPHAGAQ